jgi:selenocysteine lyase/cysteine desulfurase
MTATSTHTSLEQYFSSFRKNIIGIDQEYETIFGTQKMIYVDWTASGRLYRPIEEKLMNDFGPFVANTHTETTVSGKAMTKAYHHAKNIIKQHVNASKEDVFIATGTGMTGVVNKFQRILGLKIAENLKQFTAIPNHIKPIIFISHMEHHSNQTSWLETIADVVIIPACSKGLFCIDNLKILLEEYKDRNFKIASITSCSNVTGLLTPYYEVAKLMHQNGGVCFVDFACSGPYVHIDMHPADEESYLDAIFFSPHKFLGGPGTNGILIFNKNLYKNNVPDCPGGGTVAWTNPWGKHKYIDNIEDREDGGTPGFLQLIKTALAVQLKEKMGVENILAREHEIVQYIFRALGNIDNIVLLAAEHVNRLGVISFYIKDLHYNLGVKILSDKFGIQTRGGCSCAGTYGHYLLNLDEVLSDNFTCEIDTGNYANRPGWIRLSVHPTTTNDEVKYVCESIKNLANNFESISTKYIYEMETNSFQHGDSHDVEEKFVENWFEV